MTNDNQDLLGGLEDVNLDPAPESPPPLSAASAAQMAALMDQFSDWIQEIGRELENQGMLLTIPAEMHRHRAVLQAIDEMNHSNHREGQFSYPLLKLFHAGVALGMLCERHGLPLGRLS